MASMYPQKHRLNRFAATTVFCLATLSQTIAIPAAHAFSDGIWTNVKGNLQASVGHAILLSNGDAFTASSDNNGTTTPTSVYKAAANKWVAGPILAGSRYDPSNAPLPNRKALIAGGQRGGLSTDEAFVFDEASMTATPTASLPISVWSPATATLPNHKVILFGGYHQDEVNPGHLTDAVQIYHPASGTWTTGTPMPVTGERGCAVVLDNGLVAVRTTGSEAGDLSIMLYDPANDSWSYTGSTTGGANFIHLSGNRMFSIEGDHASIWDGTTGQWTHQAQLPNGSTGIANFAEMSDGDVFIPTSDSLGQQTTYVYRTATNQFERVATMPYNDYWSSVNLASGSLLIVGRDNGVPGTTSFLYSSAGSVATDSQAPVITSASLSRPYRAQDQSEKLTATVTDENSGVVRVEYSIGAPGGAPAPGSATPMKWDGTTASVAFDHQNINTYRINIRAMDGAGNWSPLTALYEVVYNGDPAATATSVDAFFTPASDTSEPGDSFPFMPAQPNDQARVNFNVHYRANGTVAGNFSLRFRESATNRMIVQSTTQNWLTLPTATNGRFSGVASVQTWVNGALVTRDMQYIVTLQDGFHMPQPDKLKLQLYEMSQNIFEDTPTHQLSGNVQSGDVAITGIPYSPPAQ